MNQIPKRRKPPRMAHKDETVIRSPGHLQWIRGHECSAAGRDHVCCTPIVAAHTRTETDGSMGKKPGDNWAIPLCAYLHDLQHRMGEGPFERLYGIDMKKIAAELWRVSPHRKKYEAKLSGEVVPR